MDQKSLLYGRFSAVCIQVRIYLNKGTCFVH